MNVESLRSGDQSGESAEIKIAKVKFESKDLNVYFVWIFFIYSRSFKVAITNVLLWFCIWSPYAIITMIGCFGNSMLVTPLVSQLPAFLGKSFLKENYFLAKIILTCKIIFSAKTASAINPVIYAISHPKYREALALNCPCLGVGKFSTIIVHKINKYINDLVDFHKVSNWPDLKSKKLEGVFVDLHFFFSI